MDLFRLSVLAFGSDGEFGSATTRVITTAEAPTLTPIYPDAPARLICRLESLVAEFNRKVSLEQVNSETLRKL